MKINETSDTKPHPDANGNIAAVTSPFRALAAKFSYDAFGRTTSQSGPKSGIDIHALNYRFSTKPMELELATSNTTLIPPPVSSGLYYYGYRFYSPNLGRWISRDPIREQGGRNLYNFVGNDGVGKWDLLGMLELTFAYITKIESSIIIDPLGRIFNGGIKTTQTISIDPDQCKEIYSLKSIGTTYEYDATGKIIRSGIASDSSITHSIFKSSPCECVLKMSGNASNPLAPYAPGITYSVTITFDTKIKTYTWETSHDRFPSHKLTGHSGRSLHDFSHKTSGTQPTKLLPTASNENDAGNESY